jgi:uncharacterized membrane protein YciS (DUF1049 family)
MINFQGISALLLIGITAGIMIGWLYSKEYYLDAEMEVFVKAYDRLPSKDKAIIKKYVMQHKHQ